VSRTRASAERGLGLVELMVALTMGSLLIGGTLYMYSQGRSTFAVTERAAQLQDVARYALSVIEPDLELAGYYGFTNSAHTLRLVRSGDPGRVVATAREMRQVKVLAADPAIVAVADLPAGAHDCGTNFAVDVLTPVQASNNGFQLGPGARTGIGQECGSDFGFSPIADTLTVRRAEAQTAAPEAGRIQVFAPRMASRTSHFLFADGFAPGTVNADSRVHNLVVRTYYIARDSVGRANFPALRVKTLTQIGGRAVFSDQEVIAGVEDLQVQFGIDTGDYNNDGIVDANVDLDRDGIPESDGRVTRYVDPGFPNLSRYQIVAVRLWVRVRAEQAEQGFRDKPWQYGSGSYTASGTDLAVRRAVVSRTITLRNARTL
jgi:type IV pilus assembly protein PilW